MHSTFHFRSWLLGQYHHDAFWGDVKTAVYFPQQSGAPCLHISCTENSTFDTGHDVCGIAPKLHLKLGVQIQICLQQETLPDTGNAFPGSGGAARGRWPWEHISDPCPGSIEKVPTENHRSQTGTEMFFFGSSKQTRHQLKLPRKPPECSRLTRCLQPSFLPPHRLGVLHGLGVPLCAEIGAHTAELQAHPPYFHMQILTVLMFSFLSPFLLPFGKCHSPSANTDFLSTT